ncbi:MAG: glycosyltransferase family 39 protein [Bacteroidales bacterium]|nr:glycosyltransferase family 39 protein [Bacteroidales bacterium]
MNKIKPKYLIFIALFIGILTPAVFTDGMFMDGAIYSVISRNLAEGKGTFWQMYFSDTLMTNFKGHPPLALYLNSIGFQLFGDSIFVERFYSLLTGFFAILAIVLIQKEFSKKKVNNVTIISLFVWLSFPLVSWTYANNMLENTMTVFILFSAFFLIKSFEKNRIKMIFLSGVFLFAAFLSKGFPALFIWAMIFFYWAVFKRITFKRMFVDSILLILFTILPVFFMFVFSEEAKNSLFQYFNEQVIGSIQNARTVNSRFFILGSMLKEMIVPVVLITSLLIISKIKKIKIKINKLVLKNSLFFFLIALSAILPIMISLKQRNFYIVPALPFLALSIGYFLENLITIYPNFVSFFKKRFFLPFSYGLLVVSIVMVFIFAGKPGRDFEVLHDVYKIVKVVPEHENILICKETYSNWSLHAYLQRYGKISISNKTESDYFLSEKHCLSDSAFQKIDIDLQRFTLYKK